MSFHPWKIAKVDTASAVKFRVDSETWCQHQLFALNVNNGGCFKDIESSYNNWLTRLRKAETGRLLY